MVLLINDLSREGCYETVHDGEGGTKERVPKFSSFLSFACKNLKEAQYKP